MRKARKVATLSAVSMVTRFKYQQPVLQQPPPNYLNPAYRRFPQYQQAAQPSQQPPRPPHSHQFNQHYSEQPIGRRTFLRLVATGMAMAVLTGAGFWSLEKYGTKPPGSIPAKNDPALYSGTIVGKTVINPPYGYAIFREDVCHQHDTENIFDLDSYVIDVYFITLSKNYSCSKKGYYLEADKSNSIMFFLEPREKYEVKPWGGKFPVKEIFNACEVGRTVTLRKGKKFERLNVVSDLECVNLDSVESL